MKTYLPLYIILYFTIYNVISGEEGNQNEESGENEHYGSEDYDYENETITTCRTPSREPGYCVNLLTCPHMIQAIATYNNDPIRFFISSICGNFRVCCGVRTEYDHSLFIFGDTLPAFNDSKFEISNKLNKIATENRDFVIKNILLHESNCGFQLTDDRFYTENVTAIDEIPWLVNFVAVTALTGRVPPKKDDFYNYCSGVLISNQHVLTSSYCSSKKFIIKAVRLAQHNLRKNSTCVKDGIATKCSHLIEIPIKETELVIGNTNFVLFKLERPVEYTDYIRPICLPLNNLNKPKTGDILTTSGWADTEENKVTKKRVINKIVDDDECREGLNRSVLYERVNKQYAICTVKDVTSNSDIGENDQGSPFTYSYKHQWFIEGIVNYRFEDYLIGERITSEVLNWILDGIFHFHETS